MEWFKVTIVTLDNNNVSVYVQATDENDASKQAYKIINGYTIKNIVHETPVINN